MNTHHTLSACSLPLSRAQTLCSALSLLSTSRPVRAVVLSSLPSSSKQNGVQVRAAGEERREREKRERRDRASTRKATAIRLLQLTPLFCLCRSLVHSFSFTFRRVFVLLVALALIVRNSNSRQTQRAIAAGPFALLCSSSRCLSSLLTVDHQRHRIGSWWVHGLHDRQDCDPRDRRAGSDRQPARRLGARSGGRVEAIVCSSSFLSLSSLLLRLVGGHE